MASLKFTFMEAPHGGAPMMGVDVDGQPVGQSKVHLDILVYKEDTGNVKRDADVLFASRQTG